MAKMPSVAAASAMMQAATDLERARYKVNRLLEAYRLRLQDELDDHLEVVKEDRNNDETIIAIMDEVYTVAAGGVIDVADDASAPLQGGRAVARHVRRHGYRLVQRTEGSA